MIVRDWFRLLRRSAWENGVPRVDLYFRAADPQLFGPFSGPVRLYDLKDYQTFLDGQMPEPRPSRPWKMLPRHHRLDGTP